MNFAWVRLPTRRGAALAALIVVLAAGIGVGLIQVRVDTGTDSFLPATDPSMVAVERKARDFGGDPVIVLLRYREPRVFVTDHDQLFALLKVEGQLAKLPDVATVYGPATVLNQLAGAAQNFLAQMVGRRDGLRQTAEQATRQAGKSAAEVAAAGEAAVDEFDRRYAPLIVRGLPVGLPTLNNPRFAGAVIFGPDGQAKPEWRFIVPTPDTVALLVRPRQHLDEVGDQRLVAAIRSTVDDGRLTTSSTLVSGVPTVTSELDAQISKETPLIGAVVALMVLLRYLLVPAPGEGQHSWRRSRRRWLLIRLRPLLASLLGSAATLAVFGWSGHALSFATVLLLPLILGVGSSFSLYVTAVSDQRLVLLMSAGSAVAFLTLVLSPLPFVRDLGLTLAAGMLLTVGAALLLGHRVPLPPVRAARSAGAASIERTHTQPVAIERATGTASAAATARRARIIALAVGVVVAALGWAMLPRLAVAADPADLARGLPALADAASVESVLGASGEISVELRGPDVVSPAALAWSRAARTELASGYGDQLHQVVSAPSLLSFLGSSPSPEQISSALELLPSYLSSAVLRADHQVSLLVYGVRLQDLGAQQHMLAAIRTALPAPPPGYQVDIIGLPVAAARGYQLLLDDRYLANLAGIGVTGLVLLLGLRRRWDAVRAIAAALLATGWGLGTLWLLGVALSPLTVALGSLVSVTGCEFVLLLAEARRHEQRWLHLSVGYACLTSTLGYVVLAVSKLWLVREFGLVLSAAVVLSYLAALLVVWFIPRVPAETSDQAAPSVAEGVTM